MKLGVFLLRMIVGLLFIGHGMQKLAGWFGGPGLDGTAGFFESLGLRPAKVHATAAGVSETAGGALLASGLYTPVAAALVTGTMATAIDRVHWKNGIWVSDGGYEFNLVMIAAVFALADVGPGPWSLDHLRGRERHGVWWALAALGAGIVGSRATLAWAAAQAPPPDEAAPSAASAAA
jgi:putative oxidoreductase